MLFRSAGDIKLSGYVHDDVGGRFSIFDDATIFTLFFLGVSKEDVKAMLNASLDAQKEFLSENIEQNDINNNSIHEKEKTQGQVNKQPSDTGGISKEDFKKQIQARKTNR